MSMAMHMLFRASPRERSLLDWALSGALITAHSVLNLIATRSSMPYWLAPALANTVYVLGHAAMLEGVKKILGKRGHWPVWLIIVCVLYALQLLLSFQNLTGRWILMLMMPFIIGINSTVAIMLFRAPRSELKPAFIPLAGVEVFSALVVLVHLIIALSNKDLKLITYGNQWLYTTGSLLVLIFLSVAMMGCSLIAFRKQELALRQSALLDSLTNCRNRRALHDIAEHEFYRANRSGVGLIVALFDIDHFKSINDTYGHAIGDEALIHVSKVVVAGLRKNDLLFRVGGEEFVVLISDSNLMAAQEIADRLRRSVEQTPLQTASSTIPITVSVGVAEQARTDSRWDEIMARADVAMYRAKKDGRNRVRVFGLDPT